MNFDIKNISLANEGRLRIDWAERHMEVLGTIKKRFSKKKPLKNIRISACLHVTAETAVLMRTLKAGGASVALVPSNPLSTQDDVAASLVKHDGIPVYAICGEDRALYYKHLEMALSFEPHITMDDGADLISLMHGKKKSAAANLWGSTEETTTGVHRLKALEKSGELNFPVIAVNDSKTKHLFDNRYGTGQSTIDGIIRATNLLLAGKVIVVAGYGMCGKGVAMRAKGMGGHIIVTEVDPVRALEARMDGFLVMPMIQACAQADVIITVTGDINVLDRKHFLKMKDGVIICNSGHFDVEINLVALKELAKEKRIVRPFAEEYILKKTEKRIIVLGEGRLVNLTSAEGHPPTVMDMSFANQALAAEYIARHHKDLEKKVYTLPDETDQEVALLKLEALGSTIDELTKEQRVYMSSWHLGT